MSRLNREIITEMAYLGAQLSIGRNDGHLAHGDDEDCA